MVSQLMWLIIKIILKGDLTMMVIFYAQRVVLYKSNFTAQKGDQQYIPPSLREKVAQEVLDAGLPELVPVEYGGTLKE